LGRTSSPTNYALRSIHFINENTGWVVGELGLILKTTNGGVTFIEEDLSQIPLDYSLSQNYPNPFNSDTRISFSIPTMNFVRLTIYNLNGELVETIMNEEKSAGTYSIYWDSGEKSSGIYFYKLEAGNFNETKKMILLK
jgi:hypothetical protein